MGGEELLTTAHEPRNKRASSEQQRKKAREEKTVGQTTSLSDCVFEIRCVHVNEKE